MKNGIAMLALIALAGCGSDGGTAGGAAGEAVAASSGWNALDACATTGSATVSSATGSEVTGTELGPKVEPSGIGAGFSMCTFTLASGGKMTVLTREAPDGDGIDAAIAEAKTVGAEFGAVAEDMPDLGRAAMWIAKPPSLQVFIDARRYATISSFGANAMPDASDKARAAAIEVARKLAS